MAEHLYVAEHRVHRQASTLLLTPVVQRPSCIQISEMLETNEGEREDVPMINALAQGDTAMQQLFALRVSQLKASRVWSEVFEDASPCLSVLKTYAPRQKSRTYSPTVCNFRGGNP